MMTQPSPAFVEIDMDGPDKVYKAVVNAGTELADAQRVADIAENARKAVFSGLVIKYKRSGMGLGESEHMARIDEKYEQAAQGAADAAREAAAAKVLYRATEMKFEAWRTLEANHRAAARAAT